MAHEVDLDRPHDYLSGEIHHDGDGCFENGTEISFHTLPSNTVSLRIALPAPFAADAVCLRGMNVIISILNREAKKNRQLTYQSLSSVNRLTCRIR